MTRRTSEEDDDDGRWELQPASQEAAEDLPEEVVLAQESTECQ
jgi:hypothetical protein